MKILAVDDEQLMLDALTDSIRQAAPNAEIYAFRKSVEALEFAKEHPLEVAFLDIRMRGMDGLALARELLAIYPALNVIFCTSYDEYLSEAFRSVRCNGYLNKPIDAEQIAQELKHLREPLCKEELRGQCFGWFDVFYNGKPLQFKRSKTKELLAYLIDRRGASADTRTICAALWPDTPTTASQTSYFRHLVADLKQTLKQCGKEDVFLQNRNVYAIDTRKFRCDYYDYLRGDPIAKQSYCGEYMMQYDWAEMSTSWKY